MAGAAIYLGASVAGRLKRPTRDSSCAGRAKSPLFGLAPGGVCRAPRVATRAVRSYRTVSPLPVPAFAEATAGHRRSVLCGTFPGLAAGGRYPPPCPVEFGLSSRPRGDKRPHRPLAGLHWYYTTERGPAADLFRWRGRGALLGWALGGRGVLGVEALLGLVLGDEPFDLAAGVHLDVERHVQLLERYVAAEPQVQRDDVLAGLARLGLSHGSRAVPRPACRVSSSGVSFNLP